MAMTRALRLGRAPARQPARRPPRWRLPGGTLARYQGWLRRMRALGDAGETAPDDAWRLALERTAIGSPCWIEACARIDATCRRVLGIAPYDTQWLATMAMLDGRLVEMATGEGKTLATGLAAALAALCGRQVHVLTANPYLVVRDAGELAPLFHALGLTLASADEADPPDARRDAYRANVVYATARTIVFDALRDEIIARGQTGTLMLGARVLVEGPQATPILPPPDLVLIDEADSILIDEASIPLIVSMQRPDPMTRVRSWQAWKLATTLEAGTDYTLDHRTRSVELAPTRLPDADAAWINRRHRDEWLEMALCARHFHQRGSHYVIRDEQVCLVDPITGRVAEGRLWGRGLHGLIALKEGLPLPPETVTVAQTTYASYFLRYRTMGGMSGTLRELAGELAASYRLALLALPLRKPCRREILPSRLFRSEADLLAALVDRVVELHAAGRPVLIGTNTVVQSQRVADALARAAIAPQVLNAEQSAEEARIVAAAGQPGVVTVATNMAGRGTDIRLAPAVARAGGLHVLSLQSNPSARQDRQLIGRCARQGDPGSAEQWHCLELMLGERMPLASLMARLYAALGKHAARLLLPLSRHLYQRTRSAVARRQRARLRASARYWDRHLPTHSTDVHS